MIKILKKIFIIHQETLDNFGRIFSSKGEDAPLKKYSAKIYSIIKTIEKSKGIILVYSSYIDGGCVPIALALEEIGFTRLGGNSLFKTPTAQKYKIPGTESFGKYVMITGDKLLSPSNKKELKACTDPENINGEKVKVIIISRAGSEGLDFKNIRQVHILEPWFNLNRADQTIGRGIRNKSHCDLPFNERNVQIFLYGSQLLNPVIEPIDLYVYRLAEYKSIQIGKVSRLLKENAIDCLININQQDMIESNLNKQVKLTLSTGKEIDFNIGHKNDSLICDFMNCKYSCNPVDSIEGEEILTDSYTENYIIMNLEKILKRIKNLFKEHYIYKKNELIGKINAIKTYSVEQINMSLNVLIKDKNEYLIDMLNRTGRLVNIGEFYLFQPIELDDKHIISLERRRPIDIKLPKFTVKLPEDIEKYKTVVIEKQKNIEFLIDLEKRFNNSITKKGKF